MITRPKVRTLLPLLAVISALTVLLSPGVASAQESPVLTSGIVVGVDTDEQGRLTRIAIADSGGTINEFTVNDSTEYGLETQAGDRWVATQADEPVEVVNRLRDHKQRFAPVTVASVNGVAGRVVERESGKLETNLSYLFVVFAITWAGFFAYIFYVSRKQRELQREIIRLRANMKTGTDE